MVLFLYIYMSVIMGKLLDRGGIVRLNLVIRFIFVYTRENFCLKCECWSVKKYQHCRLIWKLCIVCEAVLKKAIAEMLTEMVLLFMITLIWNWNCGSKVLPRDYHLGLYNSVAYINISASVACININEHARFWISSSLFKFPKISWC